ncbi:mandelate racemase/muconate lactonizing enzyme family protein [Microbacterium sp. H37-C3]|uniref:mandelate racemase/muconate lactonizing enzyme family protein n=1 Tax=Microbacterium sp. H37-C3 TaxID=3004354 RepID=UPI0022AF8A76|nr:mandelate racemase/muconate lactonizing enzyme family protein [Microbacterium sp. H37-C3]MCZ4067444.1 mandelate racemase/muconate lactonizing enzyme family protein [Microbacterium sp. H37-C3]
MTTIAALAARLIRVPLTRPWAADVTSVGVIATHVQRSDGAEGWGFSWTPQIGAEAVLALLRHDIAPAAVGRSAEPGGAWQGLWEHLHEAGGGGVTTIALAGLDLALWDAAARAAGSSVSTLIGRRRESARVYGSGVNLHYSLDELVAQVERWVTRGFTAVKVKVGKPDVAEDLDRLRAVRSVLGADRGLMIDANQRWDLARATRSLEVLAEVRPDWIEEPLRADDLDGHAELARRLGAGARIPIAVGENLHTAYRFAEVLRRGAAQIVQPNIVRVGGITPLQRIAAIAEDAGAELHPHLLPELSGQLALTLPGGAAEPWVEDVEDAGFAELGALRGPSPIVIRDGRLCETDHLGLGLRFTDGHFTTDDREEHR